MPTAQAANAASAPSDVRTMLRELQDETILLVLPALYLSSLALFGLATGLSDLSQALVPCLAAFATGALVWALRRLHYLAAAWVLVIGCINIDLLAVRAWGSSICLLALPVGLAALFVSLRGGVLTAAACSALLLYAPTALIPANGELRTVAALGAWGAVGLAWLSLRPLLTTLQWAWSGYQQNRSLLEEARDQRLQLKQALADLADANLQLTRLNRLADGLRQAAEDARRAKEQFVANVSHELRTPLNMVIGFSETILQAPESYGAHIPPSLLADLRVILRNSQHLAALIDDVLDLSQIEAGQMALTKEHTDLAEIVEAATVAVRPLFASKGLSLEARVEEDLPPVYCDRTRIREVLLNLLSNAGRFTERGGVSLRVWRERNDIAVSVADTGPGIDPRDKDRLFRPFEQLDGSLRRRHGGTGLGLAISKSFVELHGGQMWLESQVGQGTTFYFRLPIEPATPVAAGASQWLRADWEYEQRTRLPQVRPPAVRPRMVILERGNSLQRLLTRYFDQAEIVSTRSLEEARQALRVPAQALLINEEAVGEALQRLSAEGQLPEDTPVIICSTPGAHEAALALGAADYLVKPIPRDALQAAMNRLDVRGKTVLVVDDEPEAARLFRRMLNSFGRGYRVLTTSEGRQALQMLRDERPDVLLLDLVMPDMDGYQLLAEKELDPDIRDIPVIVISAQDPAGIHAASSDGQGRVAQGGDAPAASRPAVTSAIAITRAGGIAMPQLIACIKVFGGALPDPKSRNC